MDLDIRGNREGDDIVVLIALTPAEITALQTGRW